MSNFDLADALEEPLPTPASVSCEPMRVHAPQFENHWMSANMPEPGCSNIKDDQTESVKLKEGIELVVPVNPRSLCCVGKLVLALNRMKNPLMSRDGKDGRELCSAILKNVVEETIVKMTSSSCGTRRNFSRSNSELECTLCDVSQKSIVLKEDPNPETAVMELQAVLLSGGSESRKVKFQLSKFMTMPAAQQDGQAVLLSINSFHLSTYMSGGTAKLCLERFNKDDLRSFNSCSRLSRFLFNKRAEGRDMATFESVCCPGWFISTSSDDRQPLDMCRMDAPRLRNFRMN